MNNYDMEYTKPKVTIDLEEYQELLKLKETRDNSGAVNLEITEGFLQNFMKKPKFNIGDMVFVLEKGKGIIAKRVIGIRESRIYMDKDPNYLYSAIVISEEEDYSPPETDNFVKNMFHSDRTISKRTFSFKFPEKEEDLFATKEELIESLK